MPQLKGVWLNPRNDKWFEVDKFGDRHELWIKDAKNQKKIGLGSAAKKKINAMNPKKDMDPIRITAMENGLVRMRDNQSHLIAQFSAPSNKVREILWSVALTVIRGVPSYKNTDTIRLHNLKYNDGIEIQFKDFYERLKSEQPILMKEEIDTKITDVSQKTFDEFMAEAKDHENQGDVD